MAADYGVHFAETFTGFKWIGRTILDQPELRFVFGYEQALGYLVAPRPLDKDGISAAVMLAEVAARGGRRGHDAAGPARRHRRPLRPARRSPTGRCAWIRPSAAERVRRAARRPAGGARPAPRSPTSTAFPEADLLRLELEGGVRVQVRPSGTEPKVKLYGEAVDADPTPYLDALAALPAERF